MAGQVVVLEDAQPCRSGQALRPDWQCGRGAGWGAQACQPQTGDLDLHCLAQDVHPLLGRPASPRLPGPVHLRVSIEWRWWRSWWCWWKPSLHRSADNRRHRHTARKKWANTNSRTSDMCMFCIAAIARALPRKVFCCSREFASYFVEWEGRGLSGCSRVREIASCN